jgi:hypothetical protein
MTYFGILTYVLVLISNGPKWFQTPEYEPWMRFEGDLLFDQVTYLWSSDLLRVHVSYGNLQPCALSHAGAETQNCWGTHSAVLPLSATLTIDWAVPSLGSTHHPVVVTICVKFNENPTRDVRLTERT